MKTLLIATFTSLALVGAACTDSTDVQSGGSGNNDPVSSAASISQNPDYDVTIDPADFVAGIDNPYMPFEPGSSWRLEGKSDEGKEIDVITVTDQTKEVMGVSTTVVRDVVTINGELAEKTWDWFAQDRAGNVWYFGEDTAEYDNGRKINTHGAWEAGVGGALPGIIMPADPTVTQSFRQEYYVGEAEDMGWLVETGLTKSVPAGHFDEVIHMLEWAPLEPKVVGEKFFAPGVGLIAEKNLADGTEFFELVRYTISDR